MKRTAIAILTFLLSLAMGTSAPLYAVMATGPDQPKDMGKLIGTPVKNPQGMELGRVDDFVIDDGQVAFAIITPSGESRMVAVPYAALTYLSQEHYFLLKASKEKLAAAPAYTTAADLFKSARGEEAYEYFGQRPYWTEAEMEPRGFRLPPELEFPWGPPQEPGGP